MEPKGSHPSRDASRQRGPARTGDPAFHSAIDQPPVQCAGGNRGQTPELCWEAELSVHEAGRAWQYKAAFAEHGSSKFLDRSLLIPGRSARQAQFWVDAPLEDVTKFPDAWLFLRFKTV